MQRSMDSASFRCLTNSISRFIHLATFGVSSIMPAQKDYKSVAFSLKHLIPVLDNFIDLRVPLSEALCEASENLDAFVNEAREFLENWSPRASKIITVLQSKALLLKTQVSSVKLSCIICGQVESSNATSTFPDAQFYVQETQNLKIGELSECMIEVVRSQKSVSLVVSDHLMKIAESLCLISSQDILMESIAIEKEKQIAEHSKSKEDFDQALLASEVMSHIRDFVLKLETAKTQFGVSVPSYFRCPLSLELMLDPVIVASGQTYERGAISKWLDNGLLRCPKTGMLLSHRNLIPNFTVKELIANWCEEHKVIISKNPEKQCGIKIQRGLRESSHENDFLCSLQIGSSASRSPYEVRQQIQKVKGEGYLISCEENEKLDQSSRDHSYAHSRSESVSSAISSIDYIAMCEMDSRAPCKQESVNDFSDDLRSSCPGGFRSKSSTLLPSLSENKHISSKTIAEMGVSSSRSLSLASDSEYNDRTSDSLIEKLIRSLTSDSKEIQTAASAELRFLAKYNMDNRVIIGESGAIPPLISLLHSNVELIQEHAVTALLNLSLNEKNKIKIAESNALEPLIHVLETGNAGAKENAAATLFSISLLEDYRAKIGRSGAIKVLVDLLRFGTLRGKKDAATALYSLSVYHENKARIVQAGAVKYLVDLLDPESEMIDKAVALLANLSTIAEGCSAIAHEDGIPLLVEIVETGSQRGKENAAAILLQLCINSPKYCRCILREGAVPPLVALSQTGTPRAKEKAQQLLSHFRNQRDSASARGR